MSKIDFESLIDSQAVIAQRLSQRAQNSKYFKQFDLENKSLDIVLAWAKETKTKYENGLDNDGIYSYAQGLLSLTALQKNQEKYICQVANQARKIYPEIPDSFSLEKVVACAAVLDCDLYPDNPQRQLVIQTIGNSVDETGRISLVTFICPEVDFQYLSGSEPSYYISTSVNKDFQNKRNKQMFRIFSATTYPVKLDVIVGELDEESYIFPVLRGFATNTKITTVRRLEYSKNLLKKLKIWYPNVEISVTGWSEIAPPQTQYFNSLSSFEYISEEARRMRELQNI